MTILILGLILWVSAHLFKRLMPGPRAEMGTAGRGLVAVALVVALALIIWGYRVAEFIPVWNPPSFFTHINNLLMLLAFSNQRAISITSSLSPLRSSALRLLSLSVTSLRTTQKL